MKEWIQYVKPTYDQKVNYHKNIN